MTTHVIVTYSAGFPVWLITAIVLAGAGSFLSMATRYPLAAYAGAVMAFTGWGLFFLWDLNQGHAALMVAAAVAAIWFLWRLWALKATVRAPGSPQ